MHMDSVKTTTNMLQIQKSMHLDISFHKRKTRKNKTKKTTTKKQQQQQLSNLAVHSLLALAKMKIT